MIKYVDYVCLGILSMVAYLMSDYQEVRVDTTLTFVITPLYKYYFIYIPLLLVLMAYFAVRISLFKGSVEMNSIVKMILGAGIVGSGLFYMGAAIFTSYEFLEVSANVVGVIRNILIQIYHQYNGLFMLWGAIFAVWISALLQKNKG